MTDSFGFALFTRFLEWIRFFKMWVFVFSNLWYCVHVDECVCNQCLWVSLWFTCKLKFFHTTFQLTSLSVEALELCWGGTYSQKGAFIYYNTSWILCSASAHCLVCQECSEFIHFASTPVHSHSALTQCMTPYSVSMLYKSCCLEHGVGTTEDMDFEVASWLPNCE